MTDEFESQYDTFQALLHSFHPAEAVKRLEVIGMPPEDVRRVRARHEAQAFAVKELKEPKSVVMGNRFTWYTGPKPRDKCWPALRGLLSKTMSDGALDDLDDSSTKIMSLLDHPHERSFSTRGLVVGYVQSGKTTNFTSVMAKAADSGYKLFIVLAGIHNGLRRQTQERLKKQLVEQNPTLWSQLTGPDSDFTPPENPASYFGRSNKTHVLCVVKKNATVLRKLSQWINAASNQVKDCPTLIIDDEADQATVATKSINPLIRAILEKLPKSGYVGYTASPFANLLIDPSARDLYPEHFVVNLPKPSVDDGYFGTETLFGRDPLESENAEDVEDGLNMIREIPQDDVKLMRPMKKADVDGFAPEITDSLRDSVYYFWMATAARRVRGTGNPHNTMLIHTSVNTSVHDSFRRPLQFLRENLRDSLNNSKTLERLNVLWAKESVTVPAEDFGETRIGFEQLLRELPGVLDESRVIMDNSNSEDRLDYDNGPVVAIAVGGNTLSRGLTLEGLSVSYFVRSVSAYDTLLQMGRWFGYRVGYADLPRIWMTDELRDWFRHVATVEAEMRRDIDVYMTEDENPLTFAVRLRLHPALRVTAAAKMKDAVPAASAYGGQRVQTRYFSRDPGWLLNNQKAATKLVTDAKRNCTAHDSPQDGRHVFRNVPHEHVLEFLENYAFHGNSQECDSQLLAKYIGKRVRNAGSLRRWNVAIVGNDGAFGTFLFAPGVETGRVTRARLVTAPDSEDVDIKTLMSRRDAAIDLTGDTSNLSEKSIKNERRKQLPETGLITLYPIDKTSNPLNEKQKQSREPLGLPEHAIGVGVVFPSPGTDQDSEVEWNYISANLPKDLEEEDISAVEGDA